MQAHSLHISYYTAKQAGFMPTSWQVCEINSNDRVPGSLGSFGESCS